MRMLLVLILVLPIMAPAHYAVVEARPLNGQHDTDGDGLIEIEFLEQLDAIRYDLDGDGQADDNADNDAYAAAFPGTVCPYDCNGYELVHPLDFAAADSYASGEVNTDWTTGQGWLPIQSGELWRIFAEDPFAATFDGNGHTISNLYMNRPEDDGSAGPVGLFGSAANCLIRNVSLVDVQVTGSIPVGGLLGASYYSEVRDSHVTGSVTGTVAVGGLVGFHRGQISGSHFSGAVTAREVDREDGGTNVGGLVGQHDIGSIHSSYASGVVSGSRTVGGLVGEIEGGAYVVASHSSADVGGNTGVGGLAGTNRFLISGSYATGAVTGDRAVGGLAGYNAPVGMIVASYAAGLVDGDESVGGLVGWNYDADITASYATGPVSGSENVGGFVGRNTDEAEITASYATGRVSGGDNLGGVIGFNFASATGLVWDTGTSGIDSGVGRGSAAGVTGQTTAELQAAADCVGIYQDWETHFAYDDGRYFPYLEHGTAPYIFWDFGTPSQYPALKAYLDFDDIVNWWDPVGQPRAARPPAPTPEPVMVFAPDLAVRYDRDGDKLIEVSNLEQLDAIRHDLDGDSVPGETGREAYDAAYPLSAGEAVCGNGCLGYELAGPFDFANADSYSSSTVNEAWTTGDGWQPIGSRDEYGGRFNAIFDGNGHTIANLYVNRVAASEEPLAVGLFGYAGYSTVLRNAGIVNASVSGLEYVGGLAGRNLGEVADSYVTGNMSGGSYVGGLVADNEWVIDGSWAAVSISCGESREIIGGLTGRNWGWGTITGSHATGSVSCGERSDFIGGLTGRNWGTISGSHAAGDVTGGSIVGGLVGSNGGTISRSYAAGEVTGDHVVGGLAGGGDGVIRGSYAAGRVKGGRSVGGLSGSGSQGGVIASYATGEVSGTTEIGGLIGSNTSGKVIASYATGATSGGSRVGGLAGESHSGDVVASYATGVVAGDSKTGGLIGDPGPTIRESASFWDTQTSGQETSAGGTGRTTVELQAPTGYTGIYVDWNVDLDDADGDANPATGADDFWDFGTSIQYPVLKVDFDGDGTATWQEFGRQRWDASEPPPPIIDPTSGQIPVP